MKIIFVLFILGLLLLWRMYHESQRYTIARREAMLRKPLVKPLRILHLSDIHFYGPQARLFRFFDQLAEETFDFVFITGDIIDAESGIPFCVENLKKLKSRYGVFAVFGNHDYYDYSFLDIFIHSRTGRTMPKKAIQADLLEKSLVQGGIQVLRNQTREIQMGSQSLLIHGVDDPVTGHASIRKTLENFDPQRINILLVHTVDAFLDIAENEIDISFSGHLHGGQICLPLIGPLYVPTVFGRRYLRGLGTLKGAICSFSQGLGSSRFFPFRLLVPPQAIVLEVKSKHHI